MPRVRLLAAMNVAGASRERGSEVDVDPDVASYLLEQHRVELVRGQQPATPERAITIERAVTGPASRGRRRPSEG